MTALVVLWALLLGTALASTWTDWLSRGLGNYTVTGAWTFDDPANPLADVSGNGNSLIYLGGGNPPLGTTAGLAGYQALVGGSAAGLQIPYGTLVQNTSSGDYPEFTIFIRARFDRSKWASWTPGKRSSLFSVPGATFQTFNFLWVNGPTQRGVSITSDYGEYANSALPYYSFDVWDSAVIPWSGGQDATEMRLIAIHLIRYGLTRALVHYDIDSTFANDVASFYPFFGSVNASSASGYTGTLLAYPTVPFPFAGANDTAYIGSMNGSNPIPMDIDFVLVVRGHQFIDTFAGILLPLVDRSSTVLRCGYPSSFATALSNVMPSTCVGPPLASVGTPASDVWTPFGIFAFTGNGNNAVASASLGSFYSPVYEFGYNTTATMQYTADPVTVGAAGSSNTVYSGSSLNGAVTSGGMGRDIVSYCVRFGFGSAAPGYFAPVGFTNADSFGIPVVYFHTTLSTAFVQYGRYFSRGYPTSPTVANISIAATVSQSGWNDLCVTVDGTSFGISSIVAYLNGALLCNLTARNAYDLGQFQSIYGDNGAPYALFQYQTFCTTCGGPSGPTNRVVPGSRPGNYRAPAMRSADIVLPYFPGVFIDDLYLWEGAIPYSQVQWYTSTSLMHIPTQAPTPVPSSQPTPNPTATPTTALPTSTPTPFPSAVPSSKPSAIPTSSPTTAVPSSSPSAVPSSAPTSSPSATPTSTPTTAAPTSLPSAIPTASPTVPAVTHSGLATCITNNPAATTCAPIVGYTDPTGTEEHRYFYLISDFPIEPCHWIDGSVVIWFRSFTTFDPACAWLLYEVTTPFDANANWTHATSTTRWNSLGGDFGGAVWNLTSLNGALGGSDYTSGGPWLGASTSRRYVGTAPFGYALVANPSFYCIASLITSYTVDISGALDNNNIHQCAPTSGPSPAPSAMPSPLPSATPTRPPSASPSAKPTPVPTTAAPTSVPSAAPTTAAPTSVPSASPTFTPTTAAPTTASPTFAPTTAAPTTASPSAVPTTAGPTTPVPSAMPTTAAPTTAVPSSAPSRVPTSVPTTGTPTTATPSSVPTRTPSSTPTTAAPTTAAPTSTPTRPPTSAPTTAGPTTAPTRPAFGGLSQLIDGAQCPSTAGFGCSCTNGRPVLSSSYAITALYTTSALFLLAAWMGSLPETPVGERYTKSIVGTSHSMLLFTATTVAGLIGSASLVAWIAFTIGDGSPAAVLRCQLPVSPWLTCVVCGCVLVLFVSAGRAWVHLAPTTTKHVLLGRAGVAVIVRALSWLVAGLLFAYPLSAWDYPAYYAGVTLYPTLAAIAWYICERVPKRKHATVRMDTIIDGLDISCSVFSLGMLAFTLYVFSSWPCATTYRAPVTC